MARAVSSSSASQAGSAPRAKRLGRAHRPEDPQQVGDALGVAGAPVVGEALQLSLGLLHDVAVEQLAQLRVPSSSASRLVSSASACARRSASGAYPRT
jgi:hypothetical protein